MYDAEPAPPARALHQDDLRAATRRKNILSFAYFHLFAYVHIFIFAEGKQIKSSMLPAYCDPPNPCPLGYTAQVCFLFLKPFQFHPRLQFPNLTLRTAALRILKTTRNSHKSIRSAAFPQAAD